MTFFKPADEYWLSNKTKVVYICTLSFNWYTSFDVWPQIHKRFRFILIETKWMAHWKASQHIWVFLSKALFEQFCCVWTWSVWQVGWFNITILRECDKYWPFKNIKVNNLCLVTCKQPISWFFGEWTCMIHRKQETMNLKMIAKKIRLIKFRRHKLTTSSVLIIWYSAHSITWRICVTVFCISRFCLDRVSRARNTGTSTSVISCTTDFNRISFNNQTW